MEVEAETWIRRCVWKEASGVQELSRQGGVLEVGGDRGLSYCLSLPASYNWGLCDIDRTGKIGSCSWSFSVRVMGNGTWHTDQRCEPLGLV